VVWSADCLVVAADDTAAAVVRSDGKILSNVVASQVGGTVGTVGSARMHACMHVSVLLYSCTPVLLYSCTPVLLYSCTPVLLYSCSVPPREVGQG
jgi:hypothetical protein